jgi:hypothetical protein
MLFQLISNKYFQDEKCTRRQTEARTGCKQDTLERTFRCQAFSTLKSRQGFADVVQTTDFRKFLGVVYSKFDR